MIHSYVRVCHLTASGSGKLGPYPKVTILWSEHSSSFWAKCYHRELAPQLRGQVSSPPQSITCHLKTVFAYPRYKWVPSKVFDELPTHYPEASIIVYICMYSIQLHRRSHVKADIQILCRPRLLYIQVTAVKASGRYSPSYLCQFPLQVSCMSFCRLTITACTPLTQISPSDPRVPGGILVCSGAQQLLWLAASILILE